MSNLTTLILRELRVYFYSPIAYIVLAATLLMNGWTFWILANALNTPEFQLTGGVMQFFFGGTFFFWFSLLLITPVLTMRLLSEEKRSGSIELLMTAPVTDLEVVLGKFLASWIFFILIWVPTLLYVLILKSYAPVDLGPIFSGYLGTFLVGGLFLSVGLLASAMTSNQIIAAVVSFVILLFLFSVGVLDLFLTDPVSKKIITHLSVLDQFGNFAKGILDTRHLVYYGSFIILNLFLSVRILESRRWR